MDVLISQQAGRDLETLRVLGPRGRAWGYLAGHRRGLRFIVERAFPSPAGRTLPPAAALDNLDRLWDGQLVGLFALREPAILKPATLGPYFYGKLMLDLRGDGRAAKVKAYVVDFDGRFFLSPIALSHGQKRGTR